MAIEQSWVNVLRWSNRLAAEPLIQGYPRRSDQLISIIMIIINDNISIRSRSLHTNDFGESFFNRFELLKATVEIFFKNSFLKVASYPRKNLSNPLSRKIRFFETLTESWNFCRQSRFQSFGAISSNGLVFISAGDIGQSKEKKFSQESEGVPGFCRCCETRGWNGKKAKFERKIDWWSGSSSMGKKWHDGCRRHCSCHCRRRRRRRACSVRRWWCSTLKQLLPEKKDKYRNNCFHRHRCRKTSALKSFQAGSAVASETEKNHILFRECRKCVYNNECPETHYMKTITPVVTKAAWDFLITKEKTF